MFNPFLSKYLIWINWFNSIMFVKKMTNYFSMVSTNAELDKVIAFNNPNTIRNFISLKLFSPLVRSLFIRALYIHLFIHPLEWFNLLVLHSTGFVIRNYKFIWKWNEMFCFWWQSFTNFLIWSRKNGPFRDFVKWT